MEANNFYLLPILPIALLKILYLPHCPLPIPHSLFPYYFLVPLIV